MKKYIVMSSILLGIVAAVAAVVAIRVSAKNAIAEF
jgi:hypothetical protein